MEHTLSDQEWNDLLAILRDPDPEEEEEEDAGERLRTTTDSSRVLDLYALLREKNNVWMRELAAEPLARLEGIRALPALFEAQQLGRQERHDNDGLDTILVVLLTTHQQEAASLLVRILSDLTSELRCQAVWGLSFLSKDLVLEPLLQALDDDVPEVRVEAARSLSSESFMSHETMSALLQALRDPESSVRVEAAYSLGALSVQDAAPAALRSTLMDLSGDMGDAARKGIASGQRWRTRSGS
jgi:HEAT repeat protein